MAQLFPPQRRRPLLAQEEPLPLLQRVQGYHQNQSGAQQLYQQNMAEQARQQAEYQRRLAADQVGIEPYSLFFGRQTEDPSAGFELAPADVFPGSAAVKKGLLATAAAIPSLMYWNHARKNPVPPGMLGGPVFHGTPNKWETGVPDLSKVGTGEGAQTYGHGIYFAENPDVAKTYSPRDFDAEDEMMRRYKIAESREDYFDMEVWERAMMHDTPKEIRSHFTKENGYNRGQVERAEKIAGDLENIPQKSEFYELDIPDADIDRMLDWDAPLNHSDELPQQLVKDFPDEVDDIAQMTGAPGSGYEGEPNSYGDLYQWLSAKLGGQRWASFYLADRGIPGIKYLDQQSRGKYHIQLTYKGEPYGEPLEFWAKNQVDEAVEEYQEKGFGTEVLDLGTRNFVVFDEKLLNKMSIK